MSAAESFKKYVTAQYEVVKGKYKKIGKNVYPTVNDIIIAFNKLTEGLGGELIDNDEAIEALNEAMPIKAEAPKTKTIPNVDDCANWIHDAVHSRNSPYKISDKGNEITYNRNGVETNADSNDLYYWLWSLNRDAGMGFLGGDIKAGINNLLKEYASRSLGRIYNMIKYDENSEAFTKTFIGFLYNHLEIKEDYDIFEMLFMHWMWILKRRIISRKVRHHIWLNFYGATGIGKTEMIHRMFDFMKDFVAEPGIQVFSDGTREYRKFTDNYVLFFEELAKSDSLSGFAEESYSDKGIAVMKQILTADYFDPRLLGGQEQAKVKIRFAPISVANEHLYDIIYDDTSMRRFFDFTCGRRELPKSFTELNNMLSKFPEALQGVNEFDNDGYFMPKSETGIKISKIQKSYVPTKTSTNNWIDDCDIEPDEELTSNTVFGIPFYKLYCSYCQNVGKYKASMQRVEMILARLWPNAVDDKGRIHIKIGKVYDADGKETKLDIKSAKDEAYLAAMRATIKNQESMNDFT